MSPKDYERDAFPEVDHAATVGWFIGSVSAPSSDYFFATRITGGEDPSGRTAWKITETILSTLKILPPHE